MKNLISILIVSCFVFAGCYYDKTEELNPGVGLFTPCDPAQPDSLHPVSYQHHIIPIMQNYCYSCHQGTHSSSGYELDTYSLLQIQAANGSLWNNVAHVGHGYHPMPPSFQLDSCDLRQLDYWINTETYPNN